LRATAAVPLSFVTMEAVMAHRAALRRSMAGAVLGTLALTVAACSGSSSPAHTGARSSTSGSGAASGGSFVVADTSSVQKLDPQVATNFLDLQALGLIYQPLVTLNADLQVVPDLATSWTFSNGNKTLTFQLRQGVTFDDGSPFTSAAVKASLERAMAPSTGAAAASYISTVSAISTPDPHTVVLTLKHPDFSILDGLTTTNLAILSPKAIKGGTVTSHPDGTGPFKFVNWSPDNSFTVARNPHYWGGAPAIRQVVFRTIPNEQSIASALQAGTVQMGLLTQPQVVKELSGSGLQVDRELDLNYRALMLQDRKGPLANVDARLAIQCAINRTQVLENAALGQGKVVGPVPLGPHASSAGSRGCPSPSVAKAKGYLAKAGMPHGFSFTAMMSQDLDGTSQAQAVTVQSDLAKVGIHMAIQNVAQNDYIQRWLKGDFQAAFAENGANPDPYIMYGRYFAPGANLAVPAGYSSPALASLLTQADESASASARAALDNQISGYLQRNAVWIWLFDSYDYTVLARTVHGYTPMPNEQLTGLARATMS
jgi:peptide/nickel transport system substrate-binding protein